jgi:hypothetical protein
MTKMILECFEKDDNIVDKDSCKCVHFQQHQIRLTLYVCRRALEAYDCHVELFLISVRDDRLFVSILELDCSLMKSF